jgi:hypothetical protein
MCARFCDWWLHWWMVDERWWIQGVLVLGKGGTGENLSPAKYKNRICFRKYFGKSKKLQGPSANTVKRKIVWSATVAGTP